MRMLQRPFTVKTGKREWRLTSPFHHVPRNFLTNGASVPRLFWWFLDPAGEAFEAAIIHDYDLFLDKTRFKFKSHKAFKDNLLLYNVPWYKAYPAYGAVVVFHLIKGLFK